MQYDAQGKPAVLDISVRHCEWFCNDHFVILFVSVDAPGANVTQDAGILVLTILVSSILIYNSQNVPYKKDLEKLEYAYSLCFHFRFSVSYFIDKLLL